MRIAGFVSGLDIDQMVKELMNAHRKPLVKLQQQKTLLEWKREDYRKVSVKLADFRYNKLPAFSAASALNTKKAQVSGDTTLLSARVVDPSQAQATLTVKVKQLATATSLFSSDGIAPGDWQNATLQDLGFSGTVEINGMAITIDPSKATIRDLVNEINRSEAGVAAFFDYESGKLSLTNKETGDKDLTVSDDLKNFFKLDTDHIVKGKNAEVEINGMLIIRESNKFTISGIELTLNAESQTTSAVVTPVTDTDAIVSTIKSFISAYNELISLINGELNEERFRTYLPLTEEQREKMTEKQIELWEEKARSGTLRNDSILTKVINDLRIALIANVTTSKGDLNITHLGITTGEWASRGQLVIQDEEKLREFIEANPEAVLELFSSAGTYTSPESKDVGVFNRIRSIVTEGLDMLAEKAGTSRISTSEYEPFLKNSMMESEISSLDRRISDMERKLKDLEDRYYKQFTAMETALTRYNAQANAFAGFFSN